MKKQIFLSLFFFLLVDFFTTHFFFKKTIFWKNAEEQKVYWRKKSNIYHHDFNSFVDVNEKWQSFTKRIITNSLGFRDDEKKIIQKKSDKKRIYIIGDSFIEGAGYNYKDTVAGLIKNNYIKNYEILNAGVSSYASGIYYLKTKKYLDLGYKIDYALIFLDLSDIYDELFYFYAKDNRRIINYELKQKNKSYLKKNVYKFADFLTNNFLIFKIFLIISDKTEIYKNYLKLKIKASKEFNKSFFKTTRKDALFYRMLSVDRGAWTQNEKNFDEVKIGITKTKKYLKLLFELLDNNNVKSSLVIYPWPNQIYYGDNYHQKIWEQFSKENNINFINLYKAFESNNKKKTIIKNFILGDVHWNKQGNIKIFNELKNSNFFKLNIY